jgi:small subunit ribosomal protein S18
MRSARLRALAKGDGTPEYRSDKARHFAAAFAHTPHRSRTMAPPQLDIKKMRRKKQRLKKKMTCRFCPDGVIPRPVYVDYKDVKTLKGLVDRQGRILPRRRSGTSAIYQRAVREAVLRARFIGLLPFVSDE